MTWNCSAAWSRTSVFAMLQPTSGSKQAEALLNMFLVGAAFSHDQRSYSGLTVISARDFFRDSHTTTKIN
jgi:hypothetical protein